MPGTPPALSHPVPSVRRGGWGGEAPSSLNLGDSPTFVHLKKGRKNMRCNNISWVDLIPRASATRAISSFEEKLCKKYKNNQKILWKIKKKRLATPIPKKVLPERPRELLNHLGCFGAGGSWEIWSPPGGPQNRQISPKFTSNAVSKFDDFSGCLPRALPEGFGTPKLPPKHENWWKTTPIKANLHLPKRHEFLVRKYRQNRPRKHIFSQKHEKDWTSKMLIFHWFLQYNMHPRLLQDKPKSKQTYLQSS